MIARGKEIKFEKFGILLNERPHLEGRPDVYKRQLPVAAELARSEHPALPLRRHLADGTLSGQHGLGHLVGQHHHADDDDGDVYKRQGPSTLSAWRTARAPPQPGHALCP